MSAKLLQISKDKFLLNRTNFMIARGSKLDEVVQVVFTAAGYQWIDGASYEAINPHYLLISGLPGFFFNPGSPPAAGTEFFGDVVVTLTFLGGTKASLRIPAFYYATAVQNVCLDPA